MDRKDIITMSREEIRRVGILQQVMERKITQEHAGKILGISARQIRRIQKRVKEKGEKGVIHGLRGHPSNRKTVPEIKDKILRIFKKYYLGFGPTLAAEKFLERNHLTIHPETLRGWLKEENLMYPKRKGKKHRRWRKRKECLGEMVQMDGSIHAWLEDRGDRLVLMAYIDDATGEVYARFYDHEGTYPGMDSFERYLQIYGLPQSLYLDRHTTYKSPNSLSLEEELAGKEHSQSQFQRAMEELGVKMIYASSPQAKGRIERLFKTLQDRLVKEMRLEQIDTMEKANWFLERYLPYYNQHFRRTAANPTDLHRSPPSQRERQKILCSKDSRTLRQDGTLRYQNHWYQVESSLRPKTVEIQEWLDGSLHLVYQGKELPYQEISPSLRVKQSLEVPLLRVHIRPKVPRDHPWRIDKANKKNRAASGTGQGTTFDKGFPLSPLSKSSQ
jgi:transposase